MNREMVWATGFAMFMIVAPAGNELFAQQYPVKPVRFVVPYPAGGPLDEVARAIGHRLTAAWGQQVLVDNRGGAGGSIGADVVAKSAPDGYTMLLGNAGPITVNPGLRRDLPYEPQRDLAPVTQVVAAPMLLVVHPSLPVRNVKELIQLAKSNPGRLNYASAGIGNLQHLAMESLQSMTGMKMNHVPYKGAAPAFVDLFMRERFAKRGAQMTTGGPEGLAKIVRVETSFYAKIIKSAGILPQ